jgi:hypothetical protein
MGKHFIDHKSSEILSIFQVFPCTTQMPRSQYIDFAQDIADSTSTWGKWAVLEKSPKVTLASWR